MSPKRKPQSRFSPALLGLLAALTIGLFLAGELVILMRSDAGQITLARRFGIGDTARLTRIVGKQIHRALALAGVPADSVRETVVDRGPAAVRWRIGLGPRAAPLQVNYAISRILEENGAAVLLGREGWNAAGELVVTLLVGLPRRATHELMLVRARPAADGEPAAEPARLALIVYGFGDELAPADSFFALPGPFAVAIVAGGKGSGSIFRAAHRRGREVVLHLPLEPINYPRINPGPGTLLVTMKPVKIAGEVRRYLDQAEPVAAVANHMGSLATQDMTVMSAVYRELRKRRVTFLHVNPTAGAVCKSLASDLGVLYQEPDAVLDAETRGSDARLLARRWKTVLDQARARGRMVVMVRATPLTKSWLPEALQAKQLGGVSLVPVSALLRPAPVL